MVYVDTCIWYLPPPPVPLQGFGPEALMAPLRVKKSNKILVVYVVRESVPIEQVSRAKTVQYGLYDHFSPIK